MFKFLDGKKTYLVAGMMALLVFAKTVGWITEDVYTQLIALLTATGIATLRNAIK